MRGKKVYLSILIHTRYPPHSLKPLYRPPPPLYDILSMAIHFSYAPFAFLQANALSLRSIINRFKLL